MRERRFRTITAAALSAGMAAATLALPSSAGAAPYTEVASAEVAGGAAAPQMFEALRRDLGLDPAEARQRLAREERARGAAQALRDRLGDAFGGAWLTAGATRLVVATTSPQHTAAIRRAGAEPKVVARSEARLTGLKAQLDGAARSVPAGVTGWYVDIETNNVVVLAHPSHLADAAAFVRSSGVDAAVVRVAASTESPRLLHHVQGGDAYYINGSSRCSIGFAVAGGFVTAGHCGGVGATTTGHDGAALGVVRGSAFPGTDHAWVEVGGGQQLRPWVNDYAGNSIVVVGAQAAVVGSSVCRSGSTTGWRCGVITAQNRTVVYISGAVVNGLTETNACAEGGDSGGSWLAGQQAQGVTSGGSGNCTSGGTTYFQPLNPILQAYGLQLLVASGPTIASPGNQAGVQGDPDQLQMSAAGGTGGYRWSATGLPAGLSIDPNTGWISGTIRSTGAHTVNVTATDATGGAGRTTFNWQVRRDICPTC